MITGPKKKIYLCSIEKENIEQLRQWRNKPELRQYFREYREISKEMQERWFNEKVLKDPNQINFEIHDFETKKLIGHTGLFYINWINSTGEFGIYIGDDNFRGKGHGGDALRTLLNYGFFEINLNKIWAEVYSNNEALNVYKKIGFKEEGILKNKVYKNGKYLNSHMISLLKNEWENIQKGFKKKKPFSEDWSDWLINEKVSKFSSHEEEVLELLKNLKGLMPNEIMRNIPELKEEDIKTILKEGQNAVKNVKKYFDNIIK